MKAFKKLAIGAIMVLTAFGASSGIAHATTRQAFTFAIWTATSTTGVVTIPLLATAYTGDELVVFEEDTALNLNVGQLGTVESINAYSNYACAAGTLVETFSSSDTHNVADGPHSKVGYGWDQTIANVNCVQLTLSKSSGDMTASAVDIKPDNPGTFTQLATISSDTSQCDCTGQNLSPQTNSRAVDEAFVAGYSIQGTAGATTTGVNWNSKINTENTTAPNQNNSQANGETVYSGTSSDLLTETNETVKEENALTLLVFKCV